MYRFNIYFLMQVDNDYHSKIIKESMYYAYNHVYSQWENLEILSLPGDKTLPYLEMTFFNDFFINIEYNDGKYQNFSTIRIFKFGEATKGEDSFEILKMNLTCLISGFIYWFQYSKLLKPINYSNNYYPREKNYYGPNDQHLDEELYDNIINFFIPNKKHFNKEYIVNEIKRKIKDKNIEMCDNEIEILKKENTRLSKENEALNERLNRKIIDIKDLITGGDASIPQHNSLYEQFIKFREQDISSLQALLKMRINIKQRALFMRSIAREIFKDEIEDDNIGDIVNSIEKSIKEIKIIDDINLTEFMQCIEEYVSKGIKLAENIKQAKPQGYFLWEENGVEFDSSRHQLIQGCEEGTVELTAYPGYFIIESDKSLRFFERAVVYTESEIT